MSVKTNIARDLDIKSLNIPDQSGAAESGVSSSLKQALAVRVSNVLQTTLDIEHLLELFSQQIKPAIPHEKLIYQNEHDDISVNLGRKSKTDLNYRLFIHGEQLGELTLSRKWEPSTEESQILEYALCSLIYPLRNALLYRRALQAAHKDALTGVNNRSTLDDALSREISLAKRYQRPLSLLVLDIDHFKSINDSLGHATGDCAIKAIADKTADCIRSTDILFRYGGEEFVVLLSNTDVKGAKRLAERIRRAVESMVTQCSKGETLQMTISLGLAELRPQESCQQFFSRADKALYQAKDQGRNCVRIAPQSEKQA